MTDPTNQKPKNRKNKEAVEVFTAEPVTIIADPYGFPDLNESPDEQDQLARLESAMEKEGERSLEEASRLAEALRGAEQEERELDAKADAKIQEDLDREAREEGESLDRVLPPETIAALPQAREDGSFDLHEIEACIETLLFLSDQPVKPAKIREWLGEGIPKKDVDQAISALGERLSSPRSGVALAEIAGGFQLRTKPERAALAKLLAKTQSQRLSRGAMETLSIIAYKQPVMKDEIDRIRGVDSSHFFRSLMERRLIQITGRSDLPGRPMEYATTDEFLKVFGLASLADLPPLSEIERMIPESASQGMEEDPRILQMRKLLTEMKSDPERLGYDPADDEKFLTEIRERVQSISVSTPTIEAMKTAEAAGNEEIRGD